MPLDVESRAPKVASEVYYKTVGVLGSLDSALVSYGKQTVIQ